ncbi:Uncharacterised protein [Serratia proteamaculans]|nr:Uncharacterised protein [Serratia proteamaculans]CAI2408834.1 Uncharacterised protein [Serratia proteamaculans]
MCVYNHIFTTSQPKTSASGTEKTVRSLWKQPHDGQPPLFSFHLSSLIKLQSGSFDFRQFIERPQV